MFDTRLRLYLLGRKTKNRLRNTGGHTERTYLGWNILLRLSTTNVFWCDLLFLRLDMPNVFWMKNIGEIDIANVGHPFINLG